MLKAKDLMTKVVISIKTDDPVSTAVELMTNNDITGIPVVDNHGNLIGILSEKDILRLFDTDQSSQKKPVEDFMTQPAVHFDENEGLDEVCNCLRDNYFRRVPVTAKGKLVGIISRKDLIGYIFRSRFPTGSNKG